MKTVVHVDGDDNHDNLDNDDDVDDVDKDVNNRDHCDIDQTNYIGNIFSLLGMEIQTLLETWSSLNSILRIF